MVLAHCFLFLQLGFLVACSGQKSKRSLKDSVRVIEGDIAVSLSSPEDDPNVQRSGLRNLGNIWQDRIVPYVISPIFSGATTAKIINVIEQYMNKTCIQFIDVTGRTSSVRTYLSIKQLSGCWSYVGRVRTGEQLLSIGLGCESHGIIIHEIMHALGFYHEQSRSDRDDFVAIMWENILTGTEHNFNKYSSDTVQNFKTEYDYYSVMHYRKDAFSKNGLATIVPRKNVTIGQLVGFSNLDLQEINALYQCTKPGGGLSEWSEWSPCLGSGNFSMYKERQRFCFETDRSKCAGVNARGLVFDRQNVSCSDPECVAKGYWSRWSSWSSCSALACGSNGTRTRTRACTNPAPKCGGLKCPGSNSEAVSCSPGYCIVCGGMLYSPFGFIRSPNYPQPYPNRATCVWVISVPIGYTISVSVTHLNLESHSGCLFDYVLIRDGRNSSAAQIARLCGTVRPTRVIRSTGNVLFVSFVSDGSITGGGFELHYTSGCGGVYTDIKGFLISPNYPDNYPNNAACNYAILGRTGDVVRINFTEFMLESSATCRHDYVRIHNGSSISAPIIGKYCGSRSPFSVISTVSSLFLMFKSDNSSTYRGFNASYELLGCGGVYTNTTGFLISPNYPRNYPNNRVCTYTIHGRVGDVVKVNFTDFMLESSRTCSRDYVSIHNGSSLSAPMIGKYCGSRSPFSFISTTSNLFLMFKSDGSSNFRGFNASYEIIGCGKVYTDTRGFIVSPNYPDSYPNNRICNFTILGRTGDNVRVNFTDFMLESSGYCRNDYVSIHSGSSIGAPMIGKYCGSRSPFSVFSSASSLFMMFKSDGSLSYRGFNASYEILGCDHYFASPTGSLMSPNFPNNYPNHVNCKYTIVVAPDLQIGLVFQKFSVEWNPTCNYDSLTIFDGASNTSRLIGRFCGYSPPGPIVSTGNMLHLQFTSDYIVTAKGFFANYTTGSARHCWKYKPCKNNATCIPLIGGYRCHCSINYTGRNCSEKVVPCSSNPCHNNGTCLNIYGNFLPKFNCTCTDQFIGDRCQLRSGPDDCSFEYESWFPCRWYNIAGYNLTWIKSSGSTPSYNTGPTGDATVGFNGRGHYMYVESSYPATQGQKARMCSKQFLGHSKKRFSFKYHSYVVASTKLRVILLDSFGEEKILWSTSGLERNEWLNATLDVSNKDKFVICLEYERGDHFRGDIAVDDLYFTDLGSKIPCPAGLGSLTGFYPCNYTVPRISTNPTLSVSHENSRIVFTCKYDVNSNVKAFNAEVIWYHGSSKKEIQKEMFKPWKGQARLQNKGNSNRNFQLGTFIYCKIRGWYGNFQGIATKYYESNRFFAGVLISPSTMHNKIKEGGPPLKINLTSTVPVVCSESNDCKVQVQLVHDTTEIFLTTCSVTFRNGSSFHTIEVHAKRDFIDDGNKVVTIRIAVVEGSNALDWQNHLAINDLKIEVMDIGTARCSSNGDPRLLTFDNLYYTHFHPGDHLFVKSLSRKFEVHVRTWQCGSVTCNCGIAVREGDDVIILDMCFDGIPRLRFASKKTPSEGTIVKRDPTGKSFVIKFPSGAFVRSDNFRWSGGGFANFIVQIPSDDFASTRGLCGTFDYKSNNEMLSKDGMYYDQFHHYGATAPWGFSESWKIQVRQSLFYHRAYKSSCNQHAQKTYCDCKGKPSKLNGVNCVTHKKLSQPPEFQEVGWKEIRYAGSKCKRRKKRSAEDVITLPEDDEAVDYIYDPKPLPYVEVRWPTKSGKTAAQVTYYCNKSIRDSAPGKICAKISNFNFTSFILQCIEDIKITDNFEFSSAAVRAMQDACEEVFLKNTSFWEKDPTNNGSIVPSKELADTLCPRLCSGHGQCEKGKCICDINFSSADCSIDKRKGPTILSIPGNGGTCDARNRSDCHLTRITGQDFIDSETLSCRIVKVSTGDRKSTSESLGRSYLLSFLEVLCDLGQHPVHTIGDPFKNRSFTHAIYQLQISNDKKIFSKKKVTYIIYDSKCMKCNANSLECSQKPNTCIINGYCFDDGEKYESDPCFVCKPSDSTSEFTTSCSLPGRGKNTVTLIASATVGSIVFIALIIVLVYLYSLWKKKGEMVIQERQANAAKASFDNQAYACP